jgi:WD40 repeat protein
MCRLLTRLSLALALLGIMPGGPLWAQKDTLDDLAPKTLLDAVHERVSLTLDPGGHTAVIEKIIFTPNSKQVITLGRDRTIRVWDVDTGRTVKTLHPPGHGGFRVAALSRDGKRLAVGTRRVEGNKLQPYICVLTLPEGRVDRILHGHAKEIQALAFSPDGRQLASSGEGENTRLWNLENGEPSQVLRKFTSPGLAFSPDGQRLARANTTSAEIIELATGKTQVQLQPGPGARVIWSPDGKWLATTSANETASPNRELLRVYDETGKPLWQKFPKSLLSSMAFSSDSKRLLVTFGPQLPARAPLLLDAAGKEIIQFDSPADYRPNALDGALSQDGELAATVPMQAHKAKQINGHLALVWTIKDGKIAKELGVRNWLNESRLGAAWSEDGKTVSWNWVQKPPSFHLSELQFGRSFPANKQRGAELKQGDVALERDGTFITIARTGKEERRIPAGIGFIREATLLDKDRAVLAGKLGQLQLMDLNTGKESRRFEGHTDEIVSLAPSPDKRYFMSISVDQTLRIWSPQQTRPLLTIYVNGQDWIVWTPEGYYAATPGGEKLMGWRVDNGPEKLASFYSADRFRKHLHRPDVIKLVLEKGSVAEALKAANATLGAKDTRGVQVDDLLPPRSVLAVVDQSKLPTVKLKVQAEASAKDHPITSLRLMMDGRVVPGKETLVEFKDGKAKAEVEWTFELPEGEHQLAVLARRLDSSGVSPSIRLKSVNAAKLPTLHVLAVGINSYKDGSLDLKYSAPDAEALVDAFAKNCNGQPFRDVKTRMLLSQQATTANVVKELIELRKTVAQQDLVVVFFACHGVKHKKDYYLLTHEADTDHLDKTCLSGDSLRKSLAEFKCQVLLMLDACHSAGFGEGKKLSKLGLKPATDDVTRDLTDDEYGVAVMCAAMAHEKAEGIGGHGLFTQALLDALEKKPGVHFHPVNQRIYVHHLHSYVFDMVSTRSQERQHPFLSLPWVVESFVVR